MAMNLGEPSDYHKGYLHGDRDFSDVEREFEASYATSSTEYARGYRDGWDMNVRAAKFREEAAHA